jgi:NSS family neurotransmitter:Na+ symporter
MRGEFSTKTGFIFAAAGSAVGLGNIWGFPTQVASNGGAAFIIAYVVLAFLLAYPVLMAELIIGRATRGNMVTALSKSRLPLLGKGVGVAGLITVCLILSFYALVAGWMLAHFSSQVLNVLGETEISKWLISDSIQRDIGFCTVFMMATALIVVGGVKNGIEKWSVRLMPALLVMLVGLIGYVATLDGAANGWHALLVPDFSKLADLELLLDAMGQAFFSMSLGVGTILIYGSYINKSDNLPTLGASVALLDIGVAILAGMLIIPAMYVALNSGIVIFAEDGSLLEGPNLIFSVLPALFESMGSIGAYFAVVFFALLVVAALTSSISMLEVPVAYLVENQGFERVKSVWVVAISILGMSILLAFNMQTLFGATIDLTTKYSQPLLGLLICVFVGWLWNRHALLSELQQGAPDMHNSLFWKIWPWYIKCVCPVVIGLIFYFNLLA